MKIDIPQNQYIKGIEVNADHLSVDFQPKKRVALLFISVNLNYWPYLKQVIEDCRTNFLPQHNVDYFVWSDIPKTDSNEYHQTLDGLIPQKEFDEFFRQTGARPNGQFFSKEVVKESIDFLSSQKDIHITETEAVAWPAPTLMRYHLFLNEEEKLRDYDYVFYLDADMRVVQKISDEVLGEGLTVAPHPGYAINKRYIPPLEPNPESSAFIPRLGYYSDEGGGKKRFLPFYAAGGFQGGKSDLFVQAMKDMKETIDSDFNKNYTAIWNDESHWNKYLWDFQKAGGNITFLDVSYIYPDSLIKEYYEPMWGRSYEPKIITLTKPFTLTKQAAAELKAIVGGQIAQCTTCGENLQIPTGHRFLKVVTCQGVGKPHQVDMSKI